MKENKSEFETALVTKESAGFLQAARELIVSNDQELDIANENLKGNKALQKKIREWFKKHKTKAREALNGLIQDERELLDPLGKAEGVIKGKMTPYLEEKARIRKEAEEAARRAKAEAEAALRRAQEEAEAKALAIEEERQRKAREALHDGELKKAEKLLKEKPTEVVPVKEEDFIPEETVIPEPVDLKGTHLRTTWGWELVNIDIVPRILPDGSRPLKVDHAVLTDYASKHKEGAKCPGIRFFPKTGMASKGD